MIALLTEVKVKAVVALIPHILNGHLPAPIALHILLNCLPGLNYELNTMLLSVASYFKVLEWSSEVTVLTKREMVAVGADEASSDNRPHIATDALVLVVGCESICYQRKLNARKQMVLAKYILFLDPYFMINIPSVNLLLAIFLIVE